MHLCEVSDTASNDFKKIHKAEKGKGKMKNEATEANRKAARGKLLLPLRRRTG
jgi:hypothetical protein